MIAGVRELARSRTIQLFGTLISRVDTNERVVAITFDDGPTRAYLSEIIDVLAARKVQATFFVTGSELTAYPETGKQLVAAGHELGNHTFSHERMVFKSSNFIRDEVEKTDAAIRAAGQTGEIFFRAPFCYKLIGLPSYLSSTGRISVTWDIEPESYPEVAASASAITSHVVERVRSGSIILLHVWYPVRGASRAAVPMILDELLKRGYSFVTIRELIKLKSAAHSTSNSLRITDQNETRVGFKTI
jgi:peptidoglycan-N-acetylglucosamine deacetylase